VVVVQFGDNQLDNLLAGQLFLIHIYSETTGVFYGLVLAATLGVDDLFLKVNNSFVDVLKGN